MAVRAGRGLEPGAPRRVPGRHRGVVVFLHGLFETEFSWRFGGGETYGARLRRDAGLTPLDVRYNTAATSPRTAARWRTCWTRSRRVAGGGRTDRARRPLDGRARGAQRLLHARRGDAGSATCGTRSRSAARTWARRSSRRCTTRAPRSARCPRRGRSPGFLRRRSAGIRDLRQGSLVDEDWHGRDPDALRAAACRRSRCSTARRTTSSPPPSRGRRHPVGRLLGDWLVLQPSASGRSRSRRIPLPRGGRRSTSAARTTSRCSTTRRCTSGCASGSRQRLDAG